MNSDASLKFGCKENVSDMGNSLRDENIKYTPNPKRRKLRHSAPPAEHHSMVVSTICKNHPQVLPHENFEECYGDMQGTQFIQQQEYLMGGIPQVCTNENCKKRSPKCLSRRVSFCSTTSGELHISIDTSSLAEGNDVASNENTTAGVQPQLRSYQLVGDSLLLRFAEQILHMKAKTVDGVRCIGLCVSGQKVNDLLQKVKLELYPVGDKIVLLIGTNDILQKTDESQLHQTMWSLLKELCRRARQIVLLTLPPIPKIQFRPDHWERIESFNMFIKSLEDDIIMVADISQLYITESKTCKMEFFERYYHDGERKDLIHLNKLGLTEIHSYLTDNNCLI